MRPDFTCLTRGAGGGRACLIQESLKRGYLQYVCFVSRLSRVYMNPAWLPSGTWSDKKGKLCFIYPRSRLRIWSRETGSAVPSRVSSPVLHTQAVSSAYSRDSCRFPQTPRRIPPIVTGLVPNLSGHAIACRWSSLHKCPVTVIHCYPPCVLCVFSSHPFWTSSGRTSRGHTGGRSHRRKVTQDF